VKFIGIGNSSSSNWTSIANVNIYGIPDCEGSTSIYNNSLEDQDLTLYPVPVTNGILTISSTSKRLGIIKVYNLAGQQVLTTNGNRLHSKQVNVSQLVKGVYFMKIEEIGPAKALLKFSKTDFHRSIIYLCLTSLWRNCFLLILWE